MDLIDTLRAAQLPAPAQRRAIRIRAGAAQQDIADALGVSSVAVSRWELGERSPRRDLAVRYAELLEELRTVRSGRKAASIAVVRAPDAGDASNPRDAA